MKGNLFKYLLITATFLLCIFQLYLVVAEVVFVITYKDICDCYNALG